jgi:putative ABC transport system permease protein
MFAPRLLTYAVRSLWARRTSMLANLGAIALLVFVLSTSRMLSNGVRQTLRSAGEPDRALVLKHDAWAEQGSRFPQSVLGQVAAAPGIDRGEDGTALVTGETVSHLIIGDASTIHISTLQVRGVDANVFALRPDVRIVAGRAIKPNTAEAIVGHGVAGKQDGLELGGTFELAPGRPVRVVGVFASAGSVLESEVWVDLNTARTALALEGYLNSVTVRLEDASRFDVFAATLMQDRQVGLDVERESSYYNRVSRGLADVIMDLGLVQALIFCVGALCSTTMVFFSAVAQRRREVGVLRALGFGRATIVGAFLAESSVLSMVGAAVGVGLALLTPWLEFRSVNFATGQDIAFRFQTSLDSLITPAAAALAIGVLGGVLPALRAARMDPVAAMQA